LLAGPAFAQQRPTLGYAYPAGASAGQTVEVQLGGYDWTPDMQFFVLDDRVKLERVSEVGPMIYPGAPYWFGPRALNSYKPFPIPREITARITIPPELPAGVIRWQVANANGASEPAEFVISRDTPEVSEEALPSEQSARRLPGLPLTINGRLEKKEEVDRYRFTAEQTGLITCELPTHGIGFPVQAAIQVADDAGRNIVDHVDTAGSGAQLTFAVTQGKRYTLTLHDLDYRGNRAMVYRLSLRTGPRVVATMPTSVPPNSETEVTLIGYGIATGEPQLETLTQTVISGTKTFRQAVQTAHGSAGQIEIDVSEVPETVVASASDQRATPLSLPACVCGVFDDPGGRHVYEFAGQKGDVWSIDLSSRTSSRNLDVMFSLHDVDGRVITTSDDTAGTLSARALVTIPADGRYHLLVAEQASAGGSIDAVYRLCIAKPKPSFRMTAPDHVETLIGADPITPPQRRRAGKQQTGALGIDIERIDGFAGEITLQIESLPPGFHAPAEIKLDAKQVGADIPISCDPSVTPDACPVVVKATGTLADESMITQQARLLLTPILKPRAVIRPKYPDAARTVNRGATYPAPVVIERLEEYDGPVELQMAAVPDRVRQGILGHPCSVPAGQDEGVFPLIIPEWVQTDRTSRIILNSVVTIPDAKGRPRYLVNRMDRRITMNVEGALLKISTPKTHYRVQGQSLAIPIELFRSGELAGSVTVSLHPSGAEPAAVTAEPIRLTAAQRSVELTLVPSSDQLAAGEQAYTLRAAAEHKGYPVLSETKLLLSVDPPPLALAPSR
jgi:hypothetical protein